MLIWAQQMLETPQMHEWMVSGITDLESELFGHGSWSRASVVHELDSDTRTYVLDVSPSSQASMGSATALRGYAGFWFDGDDAELMTIGVARQFQRTGIASSLLDALIGKARQQGARRMLLEVRVDNVAALSLYERFGFRRLGLRRRYYQPEGIDAYTMALDIVPHIAGFVPSHQAGGASERGSDGVTRTKTTSGDGGDTLCHDAPQYVKTEGIDDE